MNYRREDGLLMIEIEPHNAVNVTAARALGLIGLDAKLAESDRLLPPPLRGRGGEGGIPSTASAPRRARLTDAQFDELKRTRDAALSRVIDRACAEQGWDRSKTFVHVSHAGDCYCACPDGPCQHIWDGPGIDGDHFSSVTCSRCGTDALSHDLRCMP